MEFQITWSTYLTACFIAGAGYYTFILFRFYKSGLLTFKKGNNQPGPEGLISSPNQNKSVEQSEHQKQDNLMNLVHELVDELQALLKQLSLQTPSQESVIKSVSGVLKKYPSLRNSNFRQSLISFISVEAESQCKIHLSADELASLWD